MAKIKGLIRGIQGGSQTSSAERLMVPLDTSKATLETMMAVVFISAAQTLAEDFKFTSEQLKKFQELMQIRIELNRPKK